MTTWENIKKRIASAADDPAMVKYGGKMKPAFLAAFRDYLISAGDDELEQEELDYKLPTTKFSSYQVPACFKIIDVKCFDNKFKLIKSTRAEISKATNNTVLAPSVNEVKYVIRNTTIDFLSGFESKSTINKVTIIYIPDFDFTNGTNLTEFAIGSIIFNTVKNLAGIYESPNINKQN